MNTFCLNPTAAENVELKHNRSTPFNHLFYSFSRTLPLSLCSTINNVNIDHYIWRMLVAHNLCLLASCMNVRVLQAILCLLL